METTYLSIYVWHIKQTEKKLFEKNKPFYKVYIPWLILCKLYGSGKKNREKMLGF